MNDEEKQLIGDLSNTINKLEKNETLDSMSILNKHKWNIKITATYNFWSTY